MIIYIYVIPVDVFFIDVDKSHIKKSWAAFIRFTTTTTTKRVEEMFFIVINYNLQRAKIIDISINLNQNQI